MNSECPICKSPASLNDQGGGPYVVCQRCGKFKCSKLLPENSKALTPSQIANISGWIREHQDVFISEAVFKDLLHLSSPSVGEKADRLLKCFATVYEKPGTQFVLTGDSGVREWDPRGITTSHNRGIEGLRLLGLTWAEDYDELLYIWMDYLHKECGFILYDNTCFKISPKGWAHLYSLRHGTGDSQIGFIALWFDETVTPASNAIEAAIVDAGYKPLRIDKHQHNNKIDDEIIAGIRRSKFLVADFTGQRGGVYFEAGFAMGLGRPVIWLCRADEISKIHFDNRQYNFILWEPTKLAELQSALKNRIEATIGLGPFSSSTSASAKPSSPAP